MEIESGLALFARLVCRPSIMNINSNIFPEDFMKPPLVIEFSGEAGSCKSLVCYDLIISIILPKKWQGICLDGKDASVLFIDCDSNLDINNFYQLILHRIKILCKKNKISVEEGMIEKFSVNLLSKLIVLSCTSSYELATTICSLHERTINDCNISLIVIDSISSFYWQDKGYLHKSWPSMELYLNKLFKKLITIIKENNLILIATKQNLFGFKDSSSSYLHTGTKSTDVNVGTSKKLSNPDEYKYLGKVWNSQIDMKVEFLIKSSGEKDNYNFKTFYATKTYQNNTLIQSAIFQANNTGILWCNGT